MVVSCVDRHGGVASLALCCKLDDNVGHSDEDLGGLMAVVSGLGFQFG